MEGYRIVAGGGGRVDGGPLGQTVAGRAVGSANIRHEEWNPRTSTRLETTAPCYWWNREDKPYHGTGAKTLYLWYDID